MDLGAVEAGELLAGDNLFQILGRERGDVEAVTNAEPALSGRQLVEDDLGRRARIGHPAP